MSCFHINVSKRNLRYKNCLQQRKKSCQLLVCKMNNSGSREHERSLDRVRHLPWEAHLENTLKAVKIPIRTSQAVEKKEREITTAASWKGGIGHSEETVVWSMIAEPPKKSAKPPLLIGGATSGIWAKQQNETSIWGKSKEERERGREGFALRRVTTSRWKGMEAASTQALGLKLLV